jgi:hypothetical protein
MISDNIDCDKDRRKRDMVEGLSISSARPECSLINLMVEEEDNARRKPLQNSL